MNTSWKTSLSAIGAGLLFAVASFAPPTALADQSTLQSPTTGTVSGLQLTNNYNSALNALNTCNSGSSAPTNQLSGSPSAGNCWLNTSTTPNTISVYDGTSWLAAGYVDATNHVYSPAWNGGNVTSIASASSTNLCASLQPYVSVTGTTGITSFGSACPLGALKLATFTGALTLTNNVTSLILPNNGSNITTAAGDVLGAINLGSGNWKVLFYIRASGQQVGTTSNKVLVNTLSPVSVASISDTTSFTATYSEYEIDIENLIPATNGVTLYMTEQSGGSFQTSGYYWRQLNYAGAVGVTVGSNAVNFQLTGASIVQNAAGGGVTCRATVSNVSSTSVYKIIQSRCSSIGTAAAEGDQVDGGWLGGSGAITGLSFSFNSGNISSGTIKIYGWN